MIGFEEALDPRVADPDGGRPDAADRLLFRAGRPRRAAAAGPVDPQATPQWPLGPLPRRGPARPLRLVVRKDTGMPGIGWGDPTGLDGRDPATRWAEAVLACYDHRWPRSADRRLLGP